MKLSSIAKVALALLITVAGALTADAAKKRSGKKRAATTAIAVQQGATHTYCDGALVTRDYTIKRGKKSLSVEYPVDGNQALVQSTRQWIKTSILGDKPYTGSLDTPDAMMKKAFASYFKDSTEASEEISVAYSNNKIVTYNVNGYFYEGGAHGMPEKYFATFAVADGRPLAASMLPDISVMRPYIIQGFTTDDVVNMDEGNEFYNLDSIEMGSPFVMSDGLHVIYGVYEIAPYAAGFPESIIPFSRIADKVSPSVAQKYF